MKKLVCIFLATAFVVPAVGERSSAEIAYEVFESPVPKAYKLEDKIIEILNLVQEIEFVFPTPFGEDHLPLNHEVGSACYRLMEQTADRLIKENIYRICFDLEAENFAPRRLQQAFELYIIHQALLAGAETYRPVDRDIVKMVSIIFGHQLFMVWLPLSSVFHPLEIAAETDPEIWAYEFHQQYSEISFALGPERLSKAYNDAFDKLEDREVGGALGEDDSELISDFIPENPKLSDFKTARDSGDFAAYELMAGRVICNEAFTQQSQTSPDSEADRRRDLRHERRGKLRVVKE